MKRAKSFLRGNLWWRIARFLKRKGEKSRKRIPGLCHLPQVEQGGPHAEDALVHARPDRSDEVAVNRDAYVVT